MNNEIILGIVDKLNVKKWQVVNTLKLLEDDNTIPFIARYRKEQTGNLDEVQIRDISLTYEYQKNLLKRKEDIIRLIDEKGLLTSSIRDSIIKATKLVELEDIYRPFKDKRETKLKKALDDGLLPLAKIIMSFPNKTVMELASNFNCEKVSDVNLKVEGAYYIIKDFIASNAFYRKWIRDYIYKTGSICSKKKKDALDKELVYSNYYDYSEKISSIKPHRILAINRGENVKVLAVGIVCNDSYILDYLRKKVIKNENSLVSDFVNDAITEAYKKNIFPSIERELRSDLTKIGEEAAISNFSSNVEQLLLTPPLKGVRVLGFDPAFRTGCKLAVLSCNGDVLDIGVIYPHEPKNEVLKSEVTLKDLVLKYNIDIIAIGNGTASRESEKFVSQTIKKYNLACKYTIVNEAGASIYSASSLAISEFPNLDVSQRSAISIGRRIQDALSELVKIDPKGIGVGLYQYDVNSKDLDNSLKFTVEKIVNLVGVNINTASFSILKYISGLTKKSIDLILNERSKRKGFKNRSEIKNIKGISSKTYEQAIGFMRILEGDNILDKTNIHPESYKYVYSILDILGCSLNDIGTDKIIKKILEVDSSYFLEKIDIDKYTLLDILESLKKPIVDPRDSLNAPILRSDVLSIDDLAIGMVVNGIVRNVVDFGAFVDIGLKNDGLIHISQISDDFIKHPSDVLKVGDVLDFYILDIDKDKNRVSLTLKKNNLVGV